MSGPTPSSSGNPGEGELRALYDAKLRAEIDDAARLLPGSDVPPNGGDPHARVLLVKGEPGVAEESGSAVLSGADGDAASRALEALGFEDGWFAVLSRPVRDAEPGAVRARLRTLIEAVDPVVVLALDHVAAGDAAGALRMGEVPFGRESRAAGRTLVAVDGLEASLSDPARKKRVWGQLKALKPPAQLW